MVEKRKSDKPGSNSEESLFDQYNRLLARYPFVMNGMQSAIIASCGCLLSQTIVGAKEFDWNEVKTMAFINFAFMTPVLVIFFGFLNRNFNSTFSKLFVDQFLFSPVFNASIIGLRLLLRGSDVAIIPSEVFKVLPKALTSAWMFWIPTRFLIISYIAPDLQLLVGALSGLVWNVIFSMILNA